MKTTPKILLFIGVLLVIFGLVKPSIPININNPHNIPSVSNIELITPTDISIKEKADCLVSVVKNMDKIDAYRLRDLYLDMATLIKLDGEEIVIKTTEEIKQANSLSGLMLKLDLKTKYADLNLAQLSKDVVVAAIGDDDIPLTPELRLKAVDSFYALAWAYNGGK